MNLLELPGDAISLELAAGEFTPVLRALSRMGGRRRRRATVDVVEIAGTRLIVMADWNELCLISTDQAGSDILRDLASGTRRAAVA